MGSTLYMRLSAALSDGKRLFAVRYSSDHIAPSVYYRWSESQQGWAVVSEPLEADESGWTELEAGTFLELDGDKVTMTEFAPVI